MSWKTTIALVVGLLCAQNATAQTKWEELQSTVKRPWLSPTALIQVIGDWQHDRNLSGENGAAIANARLGVKGVLDHGIGYHVQAALAPGAKLIDANVSWQPMAEIGVKVGLFKAPLSAEMLTSADGIDMVDRARVVSELAPGRQVGGALGGAFAGGMVKWQVGVFNGNGVVPGGGDGSGPLYAGRVSGHFDVGGGTLEIGANAAYNDDAPGTAESRLLYGGDVRLSVAGWLLSAEVLSALDTYPGDIERKPLGLHVTAGFSPTDYLQVLARWDRMAWNTGEDGDDWVLAGVNVWPTGFSEIQLNVMVPAGTDNPERVRVVANAQLVF